MKPETFNRLHFLRMENDAVGYDMDEQRQRFDTMRGRHENGTAPRAVVAFNLFQTPPDVARMMVARLGLSPGARVLEPSAGLGRLLDVLPPSVGSVTAIEINKDVAVELYRQDRGIRLLQRDFLTVTTKETGLFDAVIMNPPFHMRADIRHILHAVNFLKPGGTLVALCLSGHRREEMLKPLAACWEPLQAGCFKESGTNIAPVLLTIKTP